MEGVNGGASELSSREAEGMDTMVGEFRYSLLDVAQARLNYYCYCHGRGDKFEYVQMHNIAQERIKI